MPNNITIESELFFVAYYPLFLIIVGTLFNFLTFIILRHSLFKGTRKQPTIYYLRAIAIFDIFMLYGWNLNHYLLAVHGFTLLKYSVLSCKLDMYFGYSTTQISAWLRVFVCIDRYILLSRLHRTWFNKSKTVLIIIASVILFFSLFNLHLPIFNCYYTSDGTVNLNAWLYSILPAWDYIHIIVYNGIPFILMSVFNSGVIYHLVYLHHRSTVRNSRSRNISISITLVITTCLFLIMTVPGGIVYTFFNSKSRSTLLQIFDATMFTYHITSFPLYFITLSEFRSVFIGMITFKKPERKYHGISSNI